MAKLLHCCGESATTRWVAQVLLAISCLAVTKMKIVYLATHVFVYVGNVDNILILYFIMRQRSHKTIDAKEIITAVLTIESPILRN